MASTNAAASSPSRPASPAAKARGRLRGAFHDDEAMQEAAFARFDVERARRRSVGLGRSGDALARGGRRSGCSRHCPRSRSRRSARFWGSCTPFRLSAQHDIQDHEQAHEPDPEPDRVGTLHLALVLHSISLARRGRFGADQLKRGRADAEHDFVLLRAGARWRAEKRMPLALPASNSASYFSGSRQRSTSGVFSRRAAAVR